MINLYLLLIIVLLYLHINELEKALEIHDNNFPIVNDAFEKYDDNFTSVENNFKKISVFQNNVLNAFSENDKKILELEKKIVALKKVKSGV